MLFSLFSNLVDIFSFFNVFKYLTVRTGLSMFTSMIVVFLVGTPLINYFSSKQIHNPIRDDGPSEHIVKKIGTPTMGGLMILMGVFSGVLLWGDLSNPYNWFLIYIAGSFGLLGAYDDYQKVKKNNSSGVSSRFKIIIQIILVILSVVCFCTFVGLLMDLINWQINDAGKSAQVLVTLVLNTINIISGISMKKCQLSS